MLLLVLRNLEGEFLVEWKQREIRRRRWKFRLAHGYADSAEIGTGEGVGNTF